MRQLTISDEHNFILKTFIDYGSFENMITLNWTACSTMNEGHDTVKLGSISTLRNYSCKQFYEAFKK